MRNYRFALPIVNHNRDLTSKRKDRQEITIETHDGRVELERYGDAGTRRRGEGKTVRTSRGDPKWNANPFAATNFLSSPKIPLSRIFASFSGQPSSENENENEHENEHDYV